MTPIKVGDLTVDPREHWACQYAPWERDGCDASDSRYLILSGDLEKIVGNTDGYRTLPMALVEAAKAAGIERQRVEILPPLLISHDPRPYQYPACIDIRDFWGDAYEQEHLGDEAHIIARERYAAIGGAA